MDEGVSNQLADLKSGDLWEIEFIIAAGSKGIGLTCLETSENNAQ